MSLERVLAICPNAPRGVLIGFLRLYFGMSTRDTVHLLRAHSSQTKEDQKLLNQLIQLPEPDQRIMVDVMYSGKTLAEIAAENHLSTGTLRIMVLNRLEELGGSQHGKSSNSNAA